MSMDEHERLRRELETAASSLRDDTERRNVTVRNTVIGSALGVVAAGLIVGGIALSSRGSAAPPPTPSEAVLVPPPTQRRASPRPPTSSSSPETPPQPEPPPDAEQPTLHTVQPGETLARIALRYEVPFEQIAEDNGIVDPNRIEVGQRLVIRPTAAGTMVIKPGDTLSAVARRHGVTVEALLALNPQIKDPDRILAGARLRVP